MRIAVLAPDPTVRGQVVSALLSAGHTVVEPEAAARPSVALLLDPVDASIEWSLARGAELHARLPLMVLTGRSERAAIERLLRVADDVLPWPVALDILGDHLSRLARAGNGERPRAPADGAIGAITFTAPDPSGNHEGERLRRSEGLLAQAAHLAHLGCWIFDPGRQHLDASDELCQIFGVARADLPGTASGLLSSILHPDDRCAVDAAIAGAARQPRRVELQLRVLRPDGAVRHCQVVADLEPGVVPAEARWLGTVQDVTERVEAERALQSGAAQLRRLFREMPIAFAGTDDGGVIREWNREAETIAGYSREELVDNPRGLELLYDEQERLRIRNILSHPPGRRDSRFTLRRKDGERRIVSWSNVVGARELTGLARAAMGIDVTEEEREAQRYRTLARHLPNGAVLLYDHELRYLLVDGSDLGAVGVDSADMVGRTVLETAGPALAERLEPGFRAALAGETARCEVCHREQDYEVICVPLFDSGGRVEGGMALTQNISARKRAEQQLREQRERLARVLDLSPALVVGVDLAGRTSFVNPAAEQATGYTAVELIGQSWWDAVCPGDEQRQVEEMMASMEEGGCLHNHEVMLRSKSGDSRTVAWSAERAQVHDAGTATETFFYGLDVTERNQMQERLVIAERMASVGTLAAGVAHEINNPLSYVVANLALAGEALERDADATESATTRLELRTLLAEAHQGAERVAKIVRDLRMFSRADEDRSELVDVAGSVEACLRMAANELRHRARVVRDFHPVPKVRANEARLGQVFLNLIVNAAQALPEARARTNLVRISIRCDGDQVVVEVADNGAGMAPKTMRRIFDPFFTTKPIGVGTGLGLAISHRIVTAFGGEIQVDSEQGRGSVFRVSLPAAESVAEPPPVEAGTFHATRHGRILVIDDETFVGYALRRALERFHSVTVVSSATDGMAAIASGPPFDLIICDVMLPDVSGIDFYMQLAAERPDQARRVIFMTGGAFTSRARSFLEQVPNTCLLKPFEPAALLSLVNERLAQSEPA